MNCRICENGRRKHPAFVGIHFMLVFCYLACPEKAATAATERLTSLSDTVVSVSGFDTIFSETESELELWLEVLEEEDADIEEYLFLIRELSENPADLNTASLDRLLQVPGMNFTLAQSIIEFRRKHRVEHISDLVPLSGADEGTLRKIGPFISVDPAENPGRKWLPDMYRLREGRFEMMNRFQQVLEKQRGYRKQAENGLPHYAGSPARYHQRFNYRSRHLSANLTQTKAPGEKLPHPFGFDFNSAHLAIHNLGKLSMLVVGDYGLSFGQGLVMSGSMGMGKGAGITRIRRSEQGLRPYQSTGRTNYMRGVALAWGGSLQATLFYSERKLTAAEVEGDTIRFPGSSGVHRTAAELDRRYNVGLGVMGGRLRYRLSGGILGVSGYRARFDRYIQPAQGLHHMHSFSGTDAAAAGMDYRYIWGDVQLFGEGAISAGGGKGLISGLEYTTGRLLDLSFIYRNYAANFHSLFGSGFGELSGPPGNESGMYLGIRHRPTRSITINAYFDQFRFAAPRFGTRRPTQGFDWLIHIENRISSLVTLQTLVRSKRRENDYRQAGLSGREVYVAGFDERKSIRNQLNYQITRTLRTRTRIEWVMGKAAGNEPETGVLIFQDWCLDLTARIRVDARISVFDTDSFRARIFQFENDLLYAMSNPALYDRGQRSYILLRYTSRWNLDFRAKYAMTVYENRLSVGTGPDESPGNTRSTIGLQIRYLLH